jgi:hypothetical protein
MNQLKLSSEVVLTTIKDVVRNVALLVLVSPLTFGQHTVSFPEIKYVYAYNSDIGLITNSMHEIEIFKDSYSDLGQIRDPEKSMLIHVDSLIDWKEDLGDFGQIKGKKFINRNDNNIEVIELHNSTFTLLHKISRGYSDDWYCSSYILLNKILKLNNQAIVIQLFEEGSKYADGKILPMTDNWNVKFNNRKYEAYNDTTFNSIISESKARMVTFPFKTVKHETGIGLKTGFFKDSDEWIIPPYSDSIIVSQYFIINYSYKKAAIYNQTGETLNEDYYYSYYLKNAKAAYPYEYFVQFLDGNNNLHWVDTSGKITKYKPEFNYFGCGMVTRYLEKVKLINDKLSHLYQESFVRDTTILNSFSMPFKINEVHFLNGADSLYYNQNFVCGFCGTNSFRYKENDKFGIFKVNWEAQTSELQLSDCEFIEFADTDSRSGHLIFKKNSLFGFYPIQKEGKYIQADHFDYFFAQVQLPDGRKGWVDYHGNEYFE